MWQLAQTGVILSIVCRHDQLHRLNHDMTCQFVKDFLSMICTVSRIDTVLRSLYFSRYGCNFECPIQVSGICRGISACQYFMGSFKENKPYRKNWILSIYIFNDKLTGTHTVEALESNSFFLLLKWSVCNVKAILPSWIPKNITICSILPISR